VALALGAVLGSLLLCEAAARLLLPPPRYHREPVELDPLLGFRGIPHFEEDLADGAARYVFELNSQGLRGREIPAAPAPRGASRIVFVGDSFLVGQAVREEALATSLVEGALRSEGREVEVYNLSGVDYGTAQELLLLRRLGRPLEPEAVVLFVYPANDLINNSMRLAGRTTVSAGDPIRPYLVETDGGDLELRHLDPLRAWLRRRSRFFATLERRVLATRGDRSIREDHVERLRGGRAPREDFEIFRAHRDPGEPWAQAWEETFALLRAFRDECRAMGARLLVVVVPSVHQVVRNAKGIRLDISARIARGRTLDAILDWSLPERTLARFFEAEGIEARLLLDPLREAAAAGVRVYARDEHLSARGHEIAASAVLEWLSPQRGQRLAAAPSRPGPVRLLPEGATPALLDFRSAQYLEHLGDGWISWRPPGPESPGGWLIGPSALAALAPGDGDLVVRGWAPPDARFPIDGALAVVGGGRHRFRIERPGRFAFRFAMGGAGRPAPPTAEGHLAVILGWDPAQGSSTADGLVVEALGFEPGPDAERDPA
jgi:lysophospholipase L1-like esterase